MPLVSSVTELGFEPKMSLPLDAVAETQTPLDFRPRLGPMANLIYKPCKLRWLMRFSAASTTGVAVLKVYKGETEVKTVNLELQGETVLSGVEELQIENVGGSVDWSVSVDVTTAGDAGVTATLDAKMVIETPTTVV